MTKSNNKSLSIHKGSKVADSVNPNFKAKRSPLKSKEEYVDGIKKGNRTILSQAITLIESSKPEFRELGQEILEEVMPLTGNSVRIGITGVPGVGKSTFIEAIGNRFLEEGRNWRFWQSIPPVRGRKGVFWAIKRVWPLFQQMRMPTSAPHPPQARWAVWRVHLARQCCFVKPPDLPRSLLKL